METEIQALFNGHVQGVGFRYITSSIVRAYNVTGYVKNLADGRVDLVLQGEKEETLKALNEIRQRLNSYIKAVDLLWTDLKVKRQGFTIEFD